MTVFISGPVNEAVVYALVDDPRQNRFQKNVMSEPSSQRAVDACMPSGSAAAARSAGTAPRIPRDRSAPASPSAAPSPAVRPRLIRRRPNAKTPSPGVRAFCGRQREDWIHAFSRPGSDLLSRVLRRSTISAGAFHGRVRNGIGCSRSAITTRSAKRTFKSRSCSSAIHDRRGAILGSSHFLCQGDVCVLPTGEARKRDCASPVVRRPRGA